MSERAALRGLHLHFDCASGIAGDMTLGALMQLGVPEEVVRAAVAAVGVEPERITAVPVVKGGIAAIDVKVHTDQSVGPEQSRGGARAASKDPAQSAPHEPARDGDEHGHGHGDEHGTAYREIVERLQRLEGETRPRAMDMFARVARAEASLHGTTPDEVHFHEVGAIDSLVDIVGTAAALAWLAPASVSCDVVAMGHGTIRCAHGVLPVPSPAALEILREAGGRITDGGVARELCTPTGAAIVAAAVTTWGPLPALTPVAVGYGAGDAELADRPNVLRVIAGRPADAAGDTVWRLEANVDDMSSELCEHAGAALFAAGAVDVWWTPITMKRGRPALLLGALAPDGARAAVIDAMLRETTTIGVRSDRVQRRVLDRELVWVETPLGRARVKVARAGGQLVNAAPEYEDCRRLADASGVPLKRVFTIVSAAYEQIVGTDGIAENS